MSLESLLAEDTISVYGIATVKDGSGGATQTWPTLKAASVAARVDDVTSQQAERFYLRGIEVTHMVTTQQSGIVAGDRIDTSDGLHILVQSVEKIRGMGGIATYYEVGGKTCTV